MAPAPGGARAADERAFEVFARHGREPRLHHLGQVQARSETDAAVFAYTLYDERRWEDLCLVPRASITVLREVD